MNDPDFKRELRSYLTGFGLALTMTLIPFGIVFQGGLPRGTLLMLIGACTLAQAIIDRRSSMFVSFSILTCRAKNARICT